MLLAREQSVTWFFKTREGATGVLQLSGFTKDPESAKIRYKLVKSSTDAEAVVLPASLYAQDPVLIEFQALYAKTCDRPLIVLESFGTGAPVPPRLRELADEVVPWNSRDLADAIRRHARHQDTTRWDTIEFKLD